MIDTERQLLNARIEALEAEVAMLRRERDDERSMLIGVSRAYISAYRQFGQPLQDTWGRFPRIQGYRQWRAVEELAAIKGDLSVPDPSAIAERIKAVVPPAGRPMPPGVPSADILSRIEAERRGLAAGPDGGTS